AGSTLLLADLANPFVLVSLLLVLALAGLGAVDDLTKLRSRRRGLSARRKLAWQLLIAGVVAVLVYRLHAETSGGLVLRVPLSGHVLDLGWSFIPLAMLVLVGSSNAVNLTDGLDGLAGGCLLLAT